MTLAQVEKAVIAVSAGIVSLAAVMAWLLRQIDQGVTYPPAAAPKGLFRW